MQLTMNDWKTLAEMLGNTLRKGWYVRIETATEVLDDLIFVEVAGNDMVVTDEGAERTISLADIEKLHIY